MSDQNDIICVNKPEKDKNWLRRLRNDIVGSVENKIEYMKNNSLKE